MNVFALYSGKKLKSGRRYGFDVGHWHIHCFTFDTSMDKNIVWLYDRDGHKIVETGAREIIEITVCSADYEEVFSTIYYRGV
jgi:hypothetical protein